ncbi:MAG: hypothetical protein Q7S58_07555 [Candidatus Binatus sp.]|uniref:hypothetical protein n=1 Tax=Candidatus Binatus sp. TaxID=2811406 RepID=UPI0027268F5B|nr:hypothetical protein [Candidatus Binatus sp.]MDO8432250.1 hypothetical protein [Candidatus Binatus sp.]
MSSDDEPKTGEPITLDTLQHDLLVPQIQAFLEATNDPQAREVYGALAAAIDRLEVPPELAARLGAIVEVALTSGRIRKLFGPGAELSLSALFMKTPRGREIAQSLGELNRALATLKDQTVEQITASQRSPGAYALTLKTSGCQLVIRFEQAGVRIESLEVDLG